MKIRHFRKKKNRRLVRERLVEGAEVNEMNGVDNRV